MFHVLQDLSLDQTRTILDGAAQDARQQDRRFLRQLHGRGGIEAKGIAPVKPWLTALAGAKDKAALIAEAAKLQTMGIGGLFGMGVGQDSKAPDTYIVFARPVGPRRCPTATIT